MVDLIPTKFTGRATHYAIHAWGAPFQGLLRRLVDHLSAQQPAGKRTMSLHSKQQHLSPWLKSLCSKRPLMPFSMSFARLHSKAACP